MKRGMVSGSFDPPTWGHLDLVRRAAALFDEVVVCLFRNAEKTALFSEEDRLRMLHAMLEEAGLSDVRVDFFSGYVADYARENRISYVVRGLRNERDTAYEIEMARYNAARNPSLETLFLVSPAERVGISSTEARKRLEEGRDASNFLPPAVLRLARACLEKGFSSTSMI